MTTLCNRVERPFLTPTVPPPAIIDGGMATSHEHCFAPATTSPVIPTSYLLPTPKNFYKNLA